MSDTTPDLAARAAELETKSKQLAEAAAEAERDAKALNPQTEPEAVLDENFADDLKESLAEPRRRLGRIAESAR